MYYTDLNRLYLIHQIQFYLFALFIRFDQQHRISDITSLEFLTGYIFELIRAVGIILYYHTVHSNVTETNRLLVRVLAYNESLRYRI